jgi:hypothetical protein
MDKAACCCDNAAASRCTARAAIDLMEGRSGWAEFSEGRETRQYAQTRMRTLACRAQLVNRMLWARALA